MEIGGSARAMAQLLSIAEQERTLSKVERYFVIAPYNTTESEFSQKLCLLTLLYNLWITVNCGLVKDWLSHRELNRVDAALVYKVSFPLKDLLGQIHSSFQILVQ